MKDYTDIGFGKNMVKTNSRAGTREFNNVLEQGLKNESTPYLNRTAISKGTVQTTLGGLVEFYDTTGGTKVFSYDPDTGVITLNGSLVAEIGLNLGTITDTMIAGNSSQVGTLTNTRLISGGTYENGTFVTPVIRNPTVGTPTITNGTVNSVLQASGTQGTAGSIIYVKTVNFAGSAITLGTLNFSNGLNLTFS